MEYIILYFSGNKIITTITIFLMFDTTSMAYAGHDGLQTMDH